MRTINPTLSTLSKSIILVQPSRHPHNTVTPSEPLSPSLFDSKLPEKPGSCRNHTEIDEALFFRFVEEDDTTT
ncbi:hypothetical protein Hanom_Chr09g00818781 [Helianthus anomalus]